MRLLFTLMAHLLLTLARLARPGGLRSLAAESPADALLARQTPGGVLLTALVRANSAELRELLEGLSGLRRQAEPDAFPARAVTPVARAGQIWRPG